MIVCVLHLVFLFLPSDSFCLHTDASGLGIGAVLSVTQPRQEHVWPTIAENWNLQCRRGLAVIASIHHFAVYGICMVFIL